MSGREGQPDSAASRGGFGELKEDETSKWHSRVRRRRRRRGIIR